MSQVLALFHSLLRVIAKRLNSHLELHGLHDIYQSANKKCHSTESALLRVQNDLLQAMDIKQCALLVLLDQSAAFGTVHQDLQLKRLHKDWHYPMTDTVLFEVVVCSTR